MICRPAEKQEWTQLFSDLTCAIAAGRYSEASRLIDMGAGFDGDGNITPEDVRIMLAYMPFKRNI